MAKRRAEVEVTLRDRATAGLKRLGGSFGTITKAIGLVTAAATALTTILGSRFLVGAIRSAGDFNEAMSRVAAVTGASTEELKALRAAADQAGTTTRFTATEAANGLEELARAGQDANEAIATLEPVLALAAGNNQSVAESAIQVTTALNAFGLAAEDAARVSDVYTRAAQRSAQTTGQLADAMTFVAPVARQAGLDIEQTAALVGRLADQGFRGSLGGTALRNAILQLQDPTSAFRRELSALGIESDDFIEVLGELADAGENGEAAIRSLGLRAGPAIQALVSGGKPAIDELVESLRNAEGASADAAAQLENNLPGAFRSLSSAFDAARRKLVEPLVENLTEDIQRFVERVREFTESETLTRLQGLLTDTFDAARRAVVEFINGVDFAEVERRIASFVDVAQEKLANFGETVSGLRRGFDVVVGTAEVAVGTLRTAFNGLGIIIGQTVKFATDSLGVLVSFLNRTSFGASAFLRTLSDEINLTSDSISESIKGFVDGAQRGTDQIVSGFERLGSAGERAGRDVREGMDRAKTGVDGLAESAEDAADRLNRISDEAEAARATWDNYSGAVGDAADETERAADSLQKFEQVTGDFGNGIETRLVPQIESLSQAAEDAGEKIADAGETGQDEFTETGRRARQAADGVEQVGEAADSSARRASGASQIIAGVLESWRSLSESASEAVNRFLEDVGRGANTVAGFFSRLARFTRDLREQQERQVDEFTRLVDELERVGDAQGGLLRAQRLLNREVQLLDSTQVQVLESAMRAAADEADRARQSSADLVRDLEDDLLRLEGKTEELEKRRLQRRRDEIQIQLQSNNLDEESRANLQRALDLIDRKAAIREQQAQQTRAEADGSERIADAAEREADALERVNRTRRSDVSRDGRIEIDLRTTASETGAPNFTNSDLANLANQLTPRILEAIRNDLGRGL